MKYILLCNLLIINITSSISKYVFIGAGGCDDDDPTCYEPDGTNFISTCSLDADGSLEVLDTTSGIRNPAWLLRHPTFDILYATETGASSVWSLSMENMISKDQEKVQLSFIQEVPNLVLGSSVVTGDAPVYLSLDVSAQFLFVANYNGGSLSAVSLNSTGHVSHLSSQVQHYGHGVNEDRQEAPHVHGLYVTPLGNEGLSLVYAMDLGLDRIFWYSFDPSSGQLTNGTGGGDSGNDNFIYVSRLGSGPRHMVMTSLSSSTSSKVAHVITEMGNSIETFVVNSENGALTSSLGFVSTLPSQDDQDDNVFLDSKAAEILLLSSNDNMNDNDDNSSLTHYIYASNRGEAYGSNSVVTFQVDPIHGTLNATPVQSFDCGGTFPRGMGFMNLNDDVNLKEGGIKLLVGGQDSDSVSVFSMNDDGLIDTTPEYTLTDVITPVTFI
mmetsp:Transcript_13476/g.16048  ORF Transcript_13476/g.16048 Transcript_13476/m.16048 type:complete len:440 (-) Transcript_13476:47-1366(-)